MPRSDMGSGVSDANRDNAIGKHVEAIEVITGYAVLAIVMMDRAWNPYVVCPGARQLQTMETLASIDWRGALVQEDD